MERRSFKAAATIGAAALLLSAALVSASPGSGITDVAILGDGTSDGRINVNIPGSIKLQAKHGLHVVNQELTILPGGHTGWHTHSGPALVTVKSGTFRYQQTDCSYVDYTAGQTVVDEGGGHVHIGRNPGTVNTDLLVTYLLPPGAGLRTEADAITCS